METMNATTHSELLSSPIGVLEGGSLEALEDASWASDIGDGNSASLFFDIGTANEGRKETERPSENTNGKALPVVSKDHVLVEPDSQEPYSCGPDELGENDIPLGRSAEVRDYVGNVRYRAVIERHRRDYLNATKRVEKTRISNIVFRTIKERGGRFMDKANKNSVGKSRWVEISQEKALAKISQALRMGVSGTELGMGGTNNWMCVPMNYPYAHPGAPSPYGGQPILPVNTPPRRLQPSGMTISVPSSPFQQQSPYGNVHMQHGTSSQSPYHPGAQMSADAYVNEDMDQHGYPDSMQTRRSHSFAPGEHSKRPVLVGPSASMPLAYDTVEPRQHHFQTPTTRPIPLSRRKSDSAHIFRMRREGLYTGGAYPLEDPQRPASTGRVRERTGATRILSSAEATAAARTRHYTEPEVQLPIGEYGPEEGDQDPELSEWVAKVVHSMDESSVDDMDVSERNQNSDIGAEDLEPLPMDLLGTPDHEGDDSSEQFGQLLDI